MRLPLPRPLFEVVLNRVWLLCDRALLGENGDQPSDLVVTSLNIIVCKDID